MDRQGRIVSVDTVVRRQESRGSESVQRTTRSDIRFAWLITALFLVAASIVIFRHEMWRDEVQAWMIASDSTSLSNLLHNLRYDGHPALWYLLLYPIGRFTHNPAAMQALHVLLATGAVFILLRYSPFSRLQKVLMAFGYFPFYEYAIVSRNYAVGMLMIFAFCALFAKREKNLLPISVVLLLLANGSAYGWMVAIGLGMTLPVAWFVDRRNGKSWNMPVWTAFLSACIILIGLAVSAIVMKPCPDAGQYTDWCTSLNPVRVLHALAAVGSSYVLLPTVLTQWSMALSDRVIVVLFQAAFGALMLAYGFFLFAKRPVALFTYVSTTLIFLTLIYTKHMGSPRHHGHFVLMFIACLWLSSLYREAELKWRAVDRLADACNRAGAIAIPILLCIQCAVCLMVAGIDLARPFSMGKDVADFIRSRRIADMPILGDRDTPASTVAGYLDRPIYYPADHGLHTFIVYDRARVLHLSDERLIAGIDDQLSRHPDGLLVVLNHDLDLPDHARFHLRSLGKFRGAMVGDENYEVYIAEGVHARN